MSRIVIGVYAHVDGGKTTLSEAILHKCGVIKETGRVDHEDSFLDFHHYEREKGITVYSKEARFSYGNKDFIYVDTPGHLDFIGEVNRTYQILDLAILIIDASSNIPSDTIRRFSHLKSLHIPVCIFLNKMDIAHQSKDELLAAVRKQLDPSIVPYTETAEAVALNHEELLEKYLSHNQVDESYIISDLKEGSIYPLFFGSALHEEGVDELLDYICRYVEVPEASSRFKAYLYKNDEYAHLKIFSGTLRNKDVIADHKINEIVLFNGNRSEAVREVKGNDLCAVKGLQDLKPGTWLPSLFVQDNGELNTLSYRILSDLNPNELYRKISALNQEFPELNLTLSDHVSADLTGELQMDFIRKLIKERFDLDIGFSKPLISYRESIEDEVWGIGHYEPLRHYGEVLVSLRPSDSYKVKGKKEFSVLLDYLKTYRPCGLLTDSPLDQIEIEIIDVRTHLKHTEGGDLIQSLNRAIRQALSKAHSILLEPYYVVSFSGDQKTLNGIISELSSLQYVFDVEENMIMAKIAKRSFNDLIISLRNRFKDDFSHSIEGEVYDRCRNEEEVIARIGYDYRSDAAKPAGSVFTRNGAGVYIPPEEVEENMHLNIRDYFPDYKPPEKQPSRRIGEAELKRVWNSLYKEKPRFVERQSEKEKETRKESVPSKELLYLVDGYNVMHEMDNIPLDDLLTAREKVINLVCDFAGYVSAYCVLIFDAYLQDASQATVSQRDNISLVYTKKGQTADMYIEAKARELKDRYRIIVVTSDALEQLSVFSSDAFRLSSREFLARYHNMQKNMTHIEKVSNRPLEQLRELLDES